MPAKVILFPSPNQQTLDEIDWRIRACLAAMELDENLINHVSGRMKNYIAKYASVTFDCNFNLAVPINMSEKEKNALLHSVDTGITATAAQVQEMVNKIIMERILLEIEIYEDRESQKKGSKAVLFRKK